MQFKINIHGCNPWLSDPPPRPRINNVMQSCKNCKNRILVRISETNILWLAFVCSCIIVVVVRPHTMKRDVIPILRINTFVYILFSCLLLLPSQWWLDYSFVCRLSMCSVAAESMPGTEPRSITYSWISAWNSWQRSVSSNPIPSPCCCPPQYTQPQYNSSTTIAVPHAP